MKKTDEINTKNETSSTTTNTNKELTEKKPFLITKDVIDDCLSTSID
ncbi:hypothetical protein [Clostridium novyi]|nr:hypothetical protein [Clostridium novyi]